MKTCLLRASWAVSVLFIGSCDIGRAAGPVVAYSPGTELKADNLLLPVGTPRSFFLEKIGPPDAWLSTDICVYWNRRTNQPHLTREYDTVLVQFKQDRVSFMKIVAGAAIRQLLAERGKQDPAAIVATTNPPPRPGSK